jgi:hypothetical protein
MEPTVTTVITTAIDGLQDQILALAPVGLGVGVAVFALLFGFRFVKNLIS